MSVEGVRRRSRHVRVPRGDAVPGLPPGPLRPRGRSGAGAQWLGDARVESQQQRKDYLPSVLSLELECALYAPNHILTLCHRWPQERLWYHLHQHHSHNSTVCPTAWFLRTFNCRDCLSPLAADLPLSPVPMARRYSSALTACCSTDLLSHRTLTAIQRRLIQQRNAPVDINAKPKQESAAQILVSVRPRSPAHELVLGHPSPAWRLFREETIPYAPQAGHAHTHWRSWPAAIMLNARLTRMVPARLRCGVFRADAGASPTLDRSTSAIMDCCRSMSGIGTD